MAQPSIVDRSGRPMTSNGAVKTFASVDGATLDRDEAGEFISRRRGQVLAGLRGRPRRIRSGVRNPEIDTWLSGNPLERNQDIRSNRSNANAFGFHNINNQQLYDLLDEIYYQDLTVNSTLKLMVATILGKPQRWMTDEEDDAARELRDEVRDLMTESESDFGFESLLSTLLLGFSTHGFSVNEIIWEIVGDKLLPTRYLHRHPGQFVFDDRGDMFLDLGTTEQGVERQAERYVKPPPFKFALMRRTGLYGSGYGEPAIYPLRYYYWFKKEAMKAWIDYADTYGSPLAHGKIEAGNDEYLTLRDDLLEEIRNLRGDAGIVTRSDVDLKFEPRTGGQRSTPHQDIVSFMNREQMRALMGAILQAVEAEFGTRAQASEHGDTADEKIIPDAKLLSEVTTRCAVRPFVEVNYGPAATAPKFHIEIEKQEALDDMIKRLEAAKGLNVDLSEKQVRDELSVQEPKDEEDRLVGRSLDLGLDIERGPRGIDERDFSAKSEEERIYRKGKRERLDAILRPSIEVRTFAIPSRSFESDFIERLEMAAGILAEDGRAALARETRAAIKRIKDGQPLNAALSAVSARLAAFDPGEFADDLEDAIKAARAMSFLNVFDASKRFLEAPDTTDLQLAEVFEDGTKWMLDRDIMTTADLESFTEAVTSFENMTSSAADIEAEIRRNVLAIKGSLSEEATARFQRALAASVDQGLTVGEFAEAVEDLLDDGALPGGLNGYINNVFRTETANAYAVQREANFAEPAVAAHLWGWVFYNPEDDRSRVSHGNMDRVKVRKGGQAAALIPPGPPWDYQCRCSKAPIIVADLENPGVEESDDAVSKVLSIETFDQ